MSVEIRRQDEERSSVLMEGGTILVRANVYDVVVPGACGRPPSDPVQVPTDTPNPHDTAPPIFIGRVFCPDRRRSLFVACSKFPERKNRRKEEESIAHRVAAYEADAGYG